ncbi:MAG: hypothetical protein MZV65_17640 [Chromatiales bacterium]|nr:hypothetical protein [Chromatiales bacterium]
MMCEIPTNALLADAFLEHFDGLSIGSQRPDPARRWASTATRRIVARPVRRARRRGEGDAAHGDPGLPQGAASTSASAARARPTTPTSRSWLLDRGHRAASRSIRTRWSRPGCGWPRRGRRRVEGRFGMAYDVSPQRRGRRRE